MPQQEWKIRNQKAKPLGKKLESKVFLYDFKNVNKNWGWRGELVCFIVELYNLLSGTLKHQPQATACITLVQLSEMTIVKKENLSSFLRAKLNDINFYQQLLARVCWKKREQYVWTWKGIPNNCYCPENRAKHKILRIYCFA